MQNMQTKNPDLQPVPTRRAYLTTSDVQDLVRVDKSTIYRMAESGRLPAIKVGRQWRFPANEIDQWLARREEPVNRELESPDQSVQDAVDLFADLYGVMVIVTDIDGRPTTQVSNPCGYFSAIARDDRVLDRCVAEWQAMAGEYDFEPRLRLSHLGFLCTRAYIRTGNALSGMVIAGGIAPDAWPPSPAERQAIAAEAGVPREQLDSHISEIHRLPADRRDEVVAAVPRLARHLSKVTERAQTRRSNA